MIWPQSNTLRMVSVVVRQHDLMQAAKDVGSQSAQIMAFWLNSVVDEATSSTKSTYRRVLLQLTSESLEKLCGLTAPSPYIVRVVGVVRVAEGRAFTWEWAGTKLTERCGCPIGLSPAG